MTLVIFLLRTLQSSLTTFGGGVAFIPVLASVYVPEFIDSQNFYTIIAYAQATPGPIAPFITAYVGYLNFGAIGVVLGVGVLIIPTVTLVISLYPAYTKHSEHPILQIINKYMQVFLLLMFIALTLTQINLLKPHMGHYWWQLITIVLINFIGLKVFKDLPIIITIVTVVLFSIIAM